MKITTPISYEVELTEEESDIITRCEDLFYNICTQMKDRDCTSLIDSRNGTGISINEINQVLDVLDALELADVME